MLEIESYCEKDMNFIFPRLSSDSKRVFIFIFSTYRQTNEGVNWKGIVQECGGDRFKVERSLYLLQTLGFISHELTLNQRHKRYIPHPKLGMQLARYMSEEQARLRESK